MGKSIIGKNRRIDIFLVEKQTKRAFAIECKYQSSVATADEKIPYTLQDLRAMRVPGCVSYAGNGFSDGVLHMLRASDTLDCMIDFVSIIDKRRCVRTVLKCHRQQPLAMFSSPGFDALWRSASLSQ
jgi:hypothetical protein